MHRQELSGSVERGGPLIADRVIGLEDAGHLKRDFERDLDIGSGRLPCEPNGVVQEDTVRPGLVCCVGFARNATIRVLGVDCVQ